MDSVGGSDTVVSTDTRTDCTRMEDTPSEDTHTDSATSDTDTHMAIHITDEPAVTDVCENSRKCMLIVSEQGHWIFIVCLTYAR